MLQRQGILVMSFTRCKWLRQETESNFETNIVKAQDMVVNLSNPQRWLNTFITLPMNAIFALKFFSLNLYDIEQHHLYRISYGKHQSNYEII